MTPEQVISRIGIEWSKKHDCWRSFIDVQSQFFGREHLKSYIPDGECEDYEYAAAGMGGAHPETANWKQVAEPEDGDAVFMSMGALPFHIGTWVHGGILHCVKNKGEIFTKPSQLGLIGIKILEYRRYDPSNLPE